MPRNEFVARVSEEEEPRALQVLNRLDAFVGVVCFLVVDTSWACTNSTWPTGMPNTRILFFGLNEDEKEQSAKSLATHVAQANKSTITP